MSPKTKYLWAAACCMVLAVIGALSLPYTANLAPHSSTLLVLGVYAAVFLFYGFTLFMTFSWLRNDCRARGCSPMVPLGLLVLLPFPLGLLVWLACRPALQKT